MLNNLTLNSNENKTIYLFSIRFKIDLNRSHLILCFGMCEKTVMSNVFIMK